ncbi:FAD-binding oxidoreductase [Acidimangrovimonas sediminis]|uniref:FAD-binding oxidoreductase n=1 Tax=Acidimangrovimonas sediminis TaxID=2056283 RepID=UPI000C7FA597|nr:FAD-binding oxidoreductase [Acidimangrovimonas sediminis]
MTDFAALLERTLGPDLVVTGAAVPERAWSDWSGLPPVRPLALVRPRTTEDCAAAVRLCAEHGVPMVPQGGLTGLSGGAHPVAGCVALSLERMAAIEEIDTAMSTMTVGAGCVLSVAQEAARDAGLFLGLDLGARGSCSVGGNLATNAGGNRVIRYGMAREHVLGLEVVLADGTVVSSLNKMLKNNAGYDLKQMFIGSEGTLGIITRAVLRLQPAPGPAVSALCGLRDFDAVLTLLKAARAGLGTELTSFELMWPSFYDFMSKSLNLPRPLGSDHGIYVLIEASGLGDRQASEALEEVLGAALEDGILENAVLSKSEREAADLWAVRESPAHYSSVMGPLTPFDVGVPTALAGKVVAEAEAGLKARWPDAIALSYGHIGDSNLHLVVNIPSAGQDQPTKAVADYVYGVIRAAGGTVSAEHGIGVIKRGYLGYSRTPEELALMRRLKVAMDPQGILNPGKVL